MTASPPDQSLAYVQLASAKIRELATREKDHIHQAAAKIFESLRHGGVWNIFGSGHSHMAGEEAFHRAGGLIPVNAWLEEYIMPHMGPQRSGPLERLSGLAQVIFDFYKPERGEVLTLVSNSGINPVTVEMAEIAKAKGVFTLAITSVEHSKKSTSRHTGGKKLFEVSDLVIDTGGVAGDAAMGISGLDVNVGPLSSTLSLVVVNAITVRVCEIYSEKSLQAPVYLSANVAGGDARNKKLEEGYRGRIKRLY